MNFLPVSFKKTSFYAFISAFLLLASNSLGFDGYHHAVSVSSFSMIDHFNPGYSISGYPIPRYIGFHYLWFILTGFGSWGLYPVLVILHASILFSLSIRVKNYSLILKIIISFLFTINTVFFSALGFALLLIVFGFICGGKKMKQLILLGGLMHPVALICSLAALIFMRSWIYVVVLALLVFIISFFLGISIDQSTYSSRFFDLSEIFHLNSNLFSVLAKKTREISVLFLTVIFLYLYLHIKIKRLFTLKTYNLDKVNIIYFVMFLSFAVTFKAIPSHFYTGGPWSVLSWSLNSQSELEKGKISLVVLAWVSPKIVDVSYPKAQYFFRATPVKK